MMAVACVAAVLIFNNREPIYAALGIERSSETPTLNVTTDASADIQGTDTAQLTGQVVALQKKADGHFWTHARVERGTVNFMVDTGASIVALTIDDAKKVGVNVRQLDFNRPVDTAGGRIYAASITLNRVSVGAITLRDVEAVVIDEGLSQSLLGMSFLGRLQKVEATRKTMILRR